MTRTKEKESEVTNRYFPITFAFIVTFLIFLVSLELV